MDSGAQAGFFFTLDDCKALVPRLKREESFLTKAERAILLKMEKVLYRCLSIDEIEELVRDQKSL